MIGIIKIGVIGFRNMGSKYALKLNKVEMTGHSGIIKNWIDAIMMGVELISPGEEGIKALEISNAIHLSSWLDKPINLPIDAKPFL